MRVLICGGRKYSDRSRVESTMDGLHRERSITVVLSGKARGADTLGETWARKNQIQVLGFPADWKTHGQSAGPIRNRQMLVEGLPDLVVAFPGGVGTRNMVTQAKNAGVEVIEVMDKEETLSADNQKIPEILNLHTDPFAKTRPNAVYIGRPSEYGNPFVIGPDGTRAQVIAKYREHILANPDLLQKVRTELKGKDLVCFCAPEPCHGDVLWEIANPELERKRGEQGKSSDAKESQRTQKSLFSREWE